MPDATVVVIPCFNEANRLRPEELERALTEQDRLHLLFVNDGSTDGTGEQLSLLAERSPGRIDLMEMPRNVGKAEAVRRGMSHANERNARYVGFWDADLATPL